VKKLVFEPLIGVKLKLCNTRIYDKIASIVNNELVSTQPHQYLKITNDKVNKHYIYICKYRDENVLCAVRNQIDLRDFDFPEYDLYFDSLAPKVIVKLPDFKLRELLTAMHTLTKVKDFSNEIGIRYQIGNKCLYVTTKYESGIYSTKVEL
jgi:hypothetical protein